MDSDLADRVRVITHDRYKNVDFLYIWKLALAKDTEFKADFHMEQLLLQSLHHQQL